MNKDTLIAELAKLGVNVNGDRLSLPKLQQMLSLLEPEANKMEKVKAKKKAKKKNAQMRQSLIQAQKVQEVQEEPNAATAAFPKRLQKKNEKKQAKERELKARKREQDFEDAKELDLLLELEEGRTERGRSSFLKGKYMVSFNLKLEVDRGIVTKLVTQEYSADGTETEEEIAEKIAEQYIKKNDQFLHS